MFFGLGGVIILLRLLNLDVSVTSWVNMDSVLSTGCLATSVSSGSCESMSTLGILHSLSRSWTTLSLTKRWGKNYKLIIYSDLILNCYQSPFTRVTACHVATYYYVGFCYIMLRRYPDAIRTFATILNFIMRMRQYHTRSYQYDQVGYNFSISKHYHPPYPSLGRSARLQIGCTLYSRSAMPFRLVDWMTILRI